MKINFKKHLLALTGFLRTWHRRCCWCWSVVHEDVALFDGLRTLGAHRCRVFAFFNGLSNTFNRRITFFMYVRTLFLMCTKTKQMTHAVLNCTKQIANRKLSHASNKKLERRIIILALIICVSWLCNSRRTKSIALHRFFMLKSFFKKRQAHFLGYFSGGKRWGWKFMVFRNTFTQPQVGSSSNSLDSTLKIKIRLVSE